MNNNSKLFQYLVLGLFIFFIIVGALLFATYRSKNTTDQIISIKMWGTLSDASFKAFMHDYFNEADLKYTVDYTERSAETFDKDLVEAIASGKGPDAIILPQDLIVRYSDKVYSIPETVISELDFKDTFVEEGELYLGNSGVLALPLGIDPLVMYWNRDIFNTVGVTKPPATWAEINSLIPKMTKKDNTKNITQSTLALGEFRNISNAKAILSALIMQAGSQIVILDTDDQTLISVLNNNFGFSTMPALAALQFYTNFSNPAKTEYSWNRSLPNSLDAFTNGDLALYFGFASEYSKIKDKNPNLNFSVATLPQALEAKIYSTFGNIFGLAILNSSKDLNGTFSVISSLTSAEAYPAWSRIFSISSARRDILGKTEKDAAKTIFNKSAIMSRGWLDPDSTKTSTIFQEMVESYTTSRNSLSGAISTASDRLENILEN